MKIIDSKKQELQKDLEELEEYTYPYYQKLVLDIPIQKADLNNNTQKLKSAIIKRGEDLHTEVNTIVKKTNI